jgi:hypothetical protein
MVASRNTTRGGVLVGSFLVVVWIIGSFINSSLYYARRCGKSIHMEKGLAENPGILSAALFGAAWPIALFMQSFRHPSRCRHPEHARPPASTENRRTLSSVKRPPNRETEEQSETILYMNYMAEKYKQAYVAEAMQRAEYLRQEDKVETPSPQTAGISIELDAAQLAEYHYNLGHNLSGSEQQALPQGELEAYLVIQARQVRMATWQKPDINGYREGDRVRLTKAFYGRTGTYGEGSTATVLVTDTAPSSIRTARESNLVGILMDVSGATILTSGSDLLRIEGHAQVFYHDDGNVTARHGRP